MTNTDSNNMLENKDYAKMFQRKKSINLSVIWKTMLMYVLVF